MSEVQRNAFKLYVSIADSLSVGTDLMKQHIGYPIDNVIQIKLNTSSFSALFKDPNLHSTSDLSQRYNCPDLLDRLSRFFDSSLFNNHNNLASDITILVNNTYNDVDVNPVTLETACAKDGTIYNYLFKSEAQWDDVNSTSNNIAMESEEYGLEVGGGVGSNLKVYEVIGREIDNMISRNVLSTSEDGFVPDNSYDDLDNQYNLESNNFWTNLQEGDSIFIEGSFTVPTGQTTPVFNSLDRNSNSTSYSPVGSGNLPVIVQFVNSSANSYEYALPA